MVLQENKVRRIISGSAVNVRVSRLILTVTAKLPHFIRTREYRLCSVPGMSMILKGKSGTISISRVEKSKAMQCTEIEKRINLACWYLGQYGPVLQHLPLTSSPPQ